jgi:nudix-type nucleoside diphosphatase (YffH/AdpP family)
MNTTPEHTVKSEVTIEGYDVLAENWGNLRNYTVSHDRLDGTPQTVLREVYDHGSAAAVLLVDPDAQRVVLTRQFRLPPHLNGDPGWLIEACAGLLDGEAPDICARREAREETGYDPIALTELFSVYLSPGSLTEKLTCFVGTIRLGERAEAGGGVAGEGEDIEILELPISEAQAMIADGRIADAKTVLMLQWLALNPLRATPAQ